MTLEPYFQRGVIYVKKDQLDFLREYDTFPRGEFKDLLDAASYQPPFWRSPQGTATDGTSLAERRVRDERERLYTRMGIRPKDSPTKAKDTRFRDDGSRRW